MLKLFSLVDAPKDLLIAGLDPECDARAAGGLHQISELLIEAVGANPVVAVPAQVELGVDERPTELLRSLHVERKVVVEDLEAGDPLLLLHVSRAHRCSRRGSAGETACSR